MFCVAIVRISVLIDKKPDILTGINGTVGSEGGSLRILLQGRINRDPLSA